MTLTTALIAKFSCRQRPIKWPQPTQPGVTILICCITVASCTTLNDFLHSLLILFVIRPVKSNNYLIKPTISGNKMLPPVISLTIFQYFVIWPAKSKNYLIQQAVSRSNCCQSFDTLWSNQLNQRIIWSNQLYQEVNAASHFINNFSIFCDLTN